MAKMSFYGIEGLFKTGNDIRRSERDLARTLSFQSRGSLSGDGNH